MEEREGEFCCKWTPPMVFQWKLLCLSILYLLTTLFLTFYASVTPSTDICLFSLSSSSSYSDPSHNYNRNNNHHHSDLFNYPSGYGQHKYALPASSSFCNSPLIFPRYKKAQDEIQALCRTRFGEESAPSLRYLNKVSIATTAFSANFSAETRRSYFRHDLNNSSSAEREIPCGFLKPFPISQTDRLAMEGCKGVVVLSAIFGDYDKIRQPRGLGARTLRAVCFFMFVDQTTLAGLRHHKIIQTTKNNVPFHVGVWRLVEVNSNAMPYSNPAMNGVIPKYLVHRLFPNAKFSIWVDAKLQLTVDPFLLIHSLLLMAEDSNGDSVVDMAISNHPFNVHTMQEAVATARWNKWYDIQALRHQMETYCANGLQPWSPDKHPYTTDVPDTALIVRRHGLRSNLFSCLLFNELEAFNPRDQLAFAYVRDFMTPKIRINMFPVETFERIAVEYRHNLKPIQQLNNNSAHINPTANANNTKKKRKIIRASSEGIDASSCQDYLTRMWAESER